MPECADDGHDDDDHAGAGGHDRALRAAAAEPHSSVQPQQPPRPRQPQLVHPAVTILVDPTDRAELVTVTGAARLTGVSVRTVYNWMAAGKVRVRHTPTGLARIEVASLFTQKIAADAAEPAAEPQRGL